MIIKRSFCRKHLRGVQDINAIGQENLVKPPRSLNEDGSSYLGTYGKDGLYHGQGELKSKDGSLYKGSFKNGKKCGRGEHTYECGSKFVGEFVEDQAEGYGELVLVSGAKYNGSFKNSKPNGYGKLVLTSGNYYEGEFISGLKSGHGEFVKDGEKYVGSFKDDLYEGLGELIAKDGSYYKGEFKKGMRHGICSLVKTNGDKFVGQFFDDQEYELIPQDDLDEQENKLLKELKTKGLYIDSTFYITNQIPELNEDFLPYSINEQKRNSKNVTYANMSKKSKIKSHYNEVKDL